MERLSLWHKISEEMGNFIPSSLVTRVISNITFDKSKMGKTNISFDLYFYHMSLFSKFFNVRDSALSLRVSSAR